MLHVRVPARLAAGDGELPVSAGFALGVLESLWTVEVPGAVAVLGEIGAWHRLNVGDEVLRNGGADIDAVDETLCVAHELVFLRSIPPWRI
ncbi:hypothetical protein HU200_067612 [Digitaria exilis]|uniref:Uncharacterized protein n=1 Tax=Digitaria exilis TaxID=1010633 RepID=A0A835A052_9POAL|nr:hypothetical protein HU200_067612 [Digitaria exilis]